MLYQCPNCSGTNLIVTAWVYLNSPYGEFDGDRPLDNSVWCLDCGRVNADASCTLDELIEVEEVAPDA